MRYLLENEKILMSVRKHWFFIFLQLFGIGFTAFIPLFLLIVLKTASPFINFEITGGFLPLFSFFYSFWLLIFWIVGFVAWTNYYLDVWYITDQRIIDVDQKSLFSREVSSLRLDFIQDVSVHTTGFIQSLLDSADLEIETASETGVFILKNAARATKVKDFINVQLKKAVENAHAVHLVEDPDKPLKVFEVEKET